MIIFIEIKQIITNFINNTNLENNANKINK